MGTYPSRRLVYAALSAARREGFYELQQEWIDQNPRVADIISHRQALRLIERVCKRHRLRVPTLLVDHRIDPERVGGWYANGMIVVPDLPLEKFVVWHELAHHGHDTRARKVKDVTQHGPGFRRWYIRIVAEEAGTRVAERLANRIG